MIIQSARLRTNLDLAELTGHVFAGPANEEIVPLYGGPEDLATMVDDARAARKPYAIRHIKLSPEGPMTRTQLGELLCDLGDEFGFPPDRCVVIEHCKPRVGGKGYERHWHVLVPEYDPVRRRVLGAHWMRPRQEKIARLTELRLGHPPVIGRWNAAVVRALIASDDAVAAAEVAKLACAPRPESAYSGRRHQAAAGQGIALPRAQETVTAVWQQSASAAAFSAALHDVGMTVRAGDKDRTWIIETDGSDGGTPVLVGALHRLVRQPKRAVDARMRAAAPDLASQDSVTIRPGMEAPAQCGGSAGAAFKEKHDVTDNRTPYAGGCGRPGGRTARSGAGERPAPQREEGADAGSVRLPQGRIADRPAARPDRYGAAGAGRADPGRPDRNTAGPDHRATGTAGWQARRDRVRTWQALGIGLPGRDARGAKLNALLERMANMIDAGTEAAVGLQIETVAQVSGVGSRHDQTQPRLSVRDDSFSIRCTAPGLPAETRRRCWMAHQVRHGADLAWVPESVGIHIVKVEWRAVDAALVLTLRCGTRIIDRYDEVVALGEPDGPAIALMVACAQRRGWPSAAVHGSDEFRVAAARALLAAGIKVIDPPLPAEEVATLLALAASEASRFPANPVRRR